MKFDFIIGNPPYQDETIGANETYAPPIYHRFLDEAYKVGDAVELVHPARFLFNAGSTPKEWNKKMLRDPHFKVLLYESDVSKVFPNTNINGGIVISYRDIRKEFGAIGVFTQFSELDSIRKKVCNHKYFLSFKQIVASAYSYHLTQRLYEDHPELMGRLSKGHQYDLKSNIFELMPEVFLSEKRTNDYIQILGRKNNARATMWIKRQYIVGPKSLNKYKLFLAGADGAAGSIGKPKPARITGVPSIGSIEMGSTESFLSIGCFDSEEIANNALKYIKTKFARTLLSILKVTQAITPEKWAYVPLQDFTPASDIDWTASIPDIDKQLYDKYDLDEKEIEFIETHVKEMQ